jgi:ATP-dependent exoDNAse (exonuclease V) alpha subunit
MALYHLATKPVSRSAGRSAPASAAYRSGERVQEYSTGELWDYTRKRGVEYSEIVLPSEATKRDINWPRNREQLWNVAEAAEQRKDARVAREWEVALPHELNKVQRIELAKEFAYEIADRYGCAVDIALHRPHRLGDARNFHAHLLATTRTVEANGLGRKTDIELGDKDRAKKGLGRGADEISHMRERWATLTNERLRELEISARVDHRSLREQGLEREPTVHLGPAVVGMERRGIHTEVGDRVREEQRREMQRRLERAAELGQIEREKRELEKSILDVSCDLKAAVKEREQRRELETEARTEGKSAIATWRQELVKERGILREMSLARAKQLEPAKALELEQGSQHHRDQGLDRGGLELEF